MNKLLINIELVIKNVLKNFTIIDSNFNTLTHIYIIFSTGRGVMPSVKLALSHVNEHPTILINYRLHMWWNDTEVLLRHFPILISPICYYNKSDVNIFCCIFLVQCRSWC